MFGIFFWRAGNVDLRRRTIPFINLSIELYSVLLKVNPLVTPTQKSITSPAFWRRKSPAAPQPSIHWHATSAASLNGAIVNASIFKVAEHWFLQSFVRSHVKVYIRAFGWSVSWSALLMWLLISWKRNWKLCCLPVRSPRKPTGAVYKFLREIFISL